MPGGSSTALWILPGWSRTFERNVFMWRVFGAGPLAAACAAHYGLAWFVVFFVGFWPFSVSDAMDAGSSRDHVALRP
jgi:hypothetical protein